MSKFDFLCRWLIQSRIVSHPTRHFNHNPSKVGWKVNIMQENEYISPHLTELEFYPEGVLCGSNEVIDENDGVW